MYGKELVEELQREIERNRAAVADRVQRINDGLTDWEDCFVSQRMETRAIDLAKRKIKLIEDGGCAWFTELSTLDGTLVKSRWCNTRYGSSLRVEMPDGSVVWTKALTEKGLSKKGLKTVRCLRPAWFAFHSSQGGMMGAYTGDYIQIPSDRNYATGEAATSEPIAVEDF